MKNGHTSLLPDPVKRKENSLRDGQRGDDDEALVTSMGLCQGTSDEHVPVCAIHSLQICEGIIIVLQKNDSVGTCHDTRWKSQDKRIEVRKEGIWMSVSV
jgi:hypothetical protein